MNKGTSWIDAANSKDGTDVDMSDFDEPVPERAEQKAKSWGAVAQSKGEKSAASTTTAPADMPSLDEAASMKQGERRSGNSDSRDDDTHRDRNDSNRRSHDGERRRDDYDHRPRRDENHDRRSEDDHRDRSYGARRDSDRDGYRVRGRDDDRPVDGNDRRRSSPEGPRERGREDAEGDHARRSDDTRDRRRFDDDRRGGDFGGRGRNYDDGDRRDSRRGDDRDYRRGDDRRDDRRRQSPPRDRRDYDESRAPREPVPFPTEPPFSAFVNNLPYETKEEDVRGHFTDLGLKVKDVKVVLDRDTNRSKGKAYVHFDEADDLRKALDLTGDDLLLMGREIRLEVAMPRRNDDRRGGRRDDDDRRSSRFGDRGDRDDRTRYSTDDTPWARGKAPVSPKDSGRGRREGSGDEANFYRPPQARHTGGESRHTGGEPRSPPRSEEGGSPAPVGDKPAEKRPEKKGADPFGGAHAIDNLAKDREFDEIRKKNEAERAHSSGTDSSEKPADSPSRDSSRGSGRGGDRSDRGGGRGGDRGGGRGRRGDRSGYDRRDGEGRGSGSRDSPNRRDGEGRGRGSASSSTGQSGSDWHTKPGSTGGDSRDKSSSNDPVVAPVKAWTGAPSENKFETLGD